MRARVALLLTAAIVFAPGWGGAEAVATQGPLSDLAGRILAPTFDDANSDVRSKGAVAKRFERGKLQTSLSNAASAIAASRPRPPRELVLAALAVFALLTSLRFSIPQTPRAPPHLLTV